MAKFSMKTFQIIIKIFENSFKSNKLFIAK